LSSKLKPGKAAGSHDREVNASLSLKKSAVHDNNIPIKLISPEAIVLALHFCRGEYMRYVRSSATFSDGHALITCTY